MRKPSALSNLLNSVFKRKAQAPGPFTATEVARQVQVGFPPVTLSPASIHWKRTTHLRQLLNLASSSLSGPVQADKMDAHHLLKDIVSEEVELIDSYDLRALYGLDHNEPELYRHDSWESMALAPCCRQIRIISMRDFKRTVDRIIGQQQQRLQLFTSAWAPEHHYWASPLDSCELVCAVVYARLRELPLNFPVQLHRISLNKTGLYRLDQHYHVLGMSASAWSDPGFMHYLVSHKTPYARLPLCFGEQQLETLLLPRKNELASILGNGLSRAGAQNVVAALAKLTDS